MQVFTKSVRMLILLTLATYGLFPRVADKVVLAIFLLFGVVAVIRWILRNRGRIKAHVRLEKQYQQVAKATPMPDPVPAGEARRKPPKAPNPVRASVWYDLVGRDILANIPCGGGDQIGITNDGLVFTVDGVTRKPFLRLGYVPGQEEWPELAECLSYDDYQVEIRDGVLLVRW